MDTKKGVFMNMATKIRNMALLALQLAITFAVTLVPAGVLHYYRGGWVIL